LCAEHGITADAEVITADKISQTFDAVTASKTRLRHVSGNSTLPTTRR
jgi:hypothetical protein